MIRVNDKWDVAWREGLTVRDLLAACGFTHHQIVVSVDGFHVPPADFDTIPVADGASVRVVHVIGGG